jgi:transcriptional regulator with XRE-family HTH domain
MIKRQYFQALAFADAITQGIAGRPYKEVAENELGWISASMLKKLEHKAPPGMEALLEICNWLKRPVSDFFLNLPGDMPQELRDFIRNKRIEAVLMQDESEQLRKKSQALNQKVDGIFRKFEQGMNAEVIIRYFDEPEGK